MNIQDLTESQINALRALQRQAAWFAGFFNRQANRIVQCAANDR